jgi:hypothetical protein
MYGRVKSLVALKGTLVIIYLEIDDIDVAFKRMVDVIATVTGDFLATLGLGLQKGEGSLWLCVEYHYSN